jgi:pimeloyl-ACP methyl ester carboxylesterase
LIVDTPQRKRRPERSHLLGHSLGGMILTGLAIRNPDRVASLVPVMRALHLRRHAEICVEWLHHGGKPLSPL